MRLDELLVVVPHSGIIVPSEIPLDNLSDWFTEHVKNVDWYTNWLYDFRDILDNRHIAFPYCNLILDANRHPEMLDDSVPLRDENGDEIYVKGKEPDIQLRKMLAEKYLLRFHKQIQETIISGAEFLLDGHSTRSSKGISDNQIDLMNYQHSEFDKLPKHYSPDIFIETYAAELRKRLPDVKVTVNASEYYKVYGHVCSEHSVKAFKRMGRKVPAIIQETNEKLYKNPDRTPNVEAINRLRRAFAESIAATITTINEMTHTQNIIELHSLRQTFDFDCGAKAMQSIMAYYGIDIREDMILNEMKASKEGIPVENMVEFAESKGFQVVWGTEWTLEEVKRYVDEKHPVIVLLQAWAGRFLSLKEWRKNYDDGHYAIVIGYNENQIFFEDPSSFHRTWLRQNEFLARWHDIALRTGRKLENFAMALLGKDPVEKDLTHMK